MLELLGIDVEVRHNGREVVDTWRDGVWDAVLMDCQMPEMDGYETARRLRARAGPEGKLPIVALTAHALKEDLVLCLEAGMDDYVTKRFHPDTLRRTVEKWLSGQGSSPRTAATGVAPDEEEEPRLDPSRLQGLRELGRLGGSNVLREVITHFREQLLLAALRKALEDGDRQSLALHAHTLKGTSAALGAVRLSRLCGELERMAPLAEPEACARHLDGIAEEYGKVLLELAAGG
jgi:CheY-like chemotaxis protein